MNTLQYDPEFISNTQTKHPIKAFNWIQLAIYMEMHWYE